MDQEIEGERQFNELSRCTQLVRSLAIPIEEGWQTRKIWCSINLTICLQNLKNTQKTLGQLWNQVIILMKPFGYIKSAHYIRQNCVPITIKSSIDMFEQVDLMDLKTDLQSVIQCRCNIQLQNFSCVE